MPFDAFARRPSPRALFELALLVLLLALGNPVVARAAQDTAPPAPLQDSPAAACLPAGALSVFVTGSDGQLRQRVWDGASWGDWINLGGALTSSPAAVSHHGRLYLFARGADLSVWAMH